MKIKEQNPTPVEEVKLDREINKKLKGISRIHLIPAREYRDYGLGEYEEGHSDHYSYLHVVLKKDIVHTHLFAPRVEVEVTLQKGFSFIIEVEDAEPGVMTTYVLMSNHQWECIGTVTDENDGYTLAKSYESLTNAVINRLLEIAAGNALTKDPHITFKKLPVKKDKE